jgi:hypothetical protein
MDFNALANKCGQNYEDLNRSVKNALVALGQDPVEPANTGNAVPQPARSADTRDHNFYVALSTHFKNIGVVINALVQKIAELESNSAKTGGSKK